MSLYFKSTTWMLRNRDIGLKKIKIFCNLFANGLGAVVAFISLNNNFLGSEGSEVLASALKKNNTITKIELDNNNIGDEGAKHLAATLNTNNILECISLSSNNIGDGGAKAIFDSLIEDNNTIKSITMSYNNFGDESAESIASVLLYNTSITSIYIFDSKITNKGFKIIIDALTKNKILYSLQLKNMLISDEMHYLCKEYIMRNRYEYPNHFWSPYFHNSFPESSKKKIMATLMCNEILPMHIWTYIFSFWKHKMFEYPYTKN